MAPLGPVFEFTYFRSRASLEAPLGKSPLALENLAVQCDNGAAYRLGRQVIRGKVRDMSIPIRPLDLVQASINRLLFPLDLSLSVSAHGYVTRRSTLTNARPHVGARFLQKFDLSNFFSSIDTDRIDSSLRSTGFGPEAATVLARLTSCNGSLPLGSRTSPRLSNIVLLGLDDKMAAVAQRRRVSYTRYADDMTFSAKEPFDVKDEVGEVVTQEGFMLNELKSKRFKHGQPMFVTGLSVEDSEYPRVRKRLKTRLRQEFHYIEKFGLESHSAALGEDPRWTASRLTGQFHYCRTIEPAFVDGLTRNFPNAKARVIPVLSDSRSERVQRHRQDFLREVSESSAGQLPFYTPTVSMTAPSQG